VQEVASVFKDALIAVAVALAAAGACELNAGMWRLIAIAVSGQ
jgi:hypothetical protein